MNVVLPRSDQPGWKAEPGSWSTDPEGGVWVVCPNNHAARISGHPAGEGWDIDKDGKVTPSIFCRTPVPPSFKELCDWHVFATLDGWLEGASDE